MRTGVAIVAEGAQHLRLARVIGESLAAGGIEASLIAPTVLDEATAPACFRWIVSDIYAVPGFLQRVGLVLFFTNESSPFCMFSNKIGLAAEMTRTAAISVQHGWIQPGLNYSSARRRVGYVGRGSDNAHAIVHFSPVIRYDGEQGIGYPLIRSGRVEIRTPKSPEMRVLIATNFNWGVYSRESIVSFLRAMVAIKTVFPQISFLHRGHAAERSQGIAAELGFYLEVLEAVPARGELEEALSAADVVISTPSTVALDAVAAGVPAFVFCPSEFETVRPAMGYPAFSNAIELQEKIGAMICEAKYDPPPIDGFNGERLNALVREALVGAGDYRLSNADYVNFARLVKD